MRLQAARCTTVIVIFTLRQAREVVISTLDTVLHTLDVVFVAVVIAWSTGFQRRNSQRQEGNRGKRSIQTSSV